MDYIVLDLEWNQAPGKFDKDSMLPFEIVEIGAVKLNDKFEKTGEFNQLVKPQIYKTIHYMTSKIVQVDKEELDEEGRPFVEVCTEFLEWCGNDPVFCIWGTLDLTELQRNMCYYGMDELTDGPLMYFDIQKFFSLCYDDGKLRRNLESAVDYLNIEKDIPFHRAFSDAYYTAKVFKEIDRKMPEVEKYVSYDVFMIPQSEDDEIHATFKTYAKYISREFPDKLTAMADKEVSSTRCYVCGRKAPKKIDWFSANGKHYYCIAKCWRHGYIKGKARMKKADDGNVYVVKTLKRVPKSTVNDIKEKQEKLRQQRAEKRHKEKLEKKLKQAAQE